MYIKIFIHIVFSAVDAHVCRHLFDKVIGPKGILNNKTRILVTHRVSVLPYVDQIIILKDGTIAEIGSFDELVSNKGEFAEFVAEYIVDQSDSDIHEDDMKMMEEIADKVRPILERTLSYTESMVSDATSVSRRRSSIYRSTSRISSDGKSIELQSKKPDIKPKPKRIGRLIESETSETGSVKLDVYKKYIQTIGVVLSLGIFLSFLASNASQVGSSLWLSQWSNDALDPNKINDTALRDLRLGVYAGLGILEALFTLFGAISMNLACIQASKVLHNNMLIRIVRAPMSFFG